MTDDASNMLNILETERFRLRKFAMDDVLALKAVYGDPTVMEFSSGIKTPAEILETLRQIIEEQYPNWGFGKWAIELKDGGEVAGYCGLTQFPDICGPGEGELGYRLARAYWGRGLATEAARAVCDAGFTQFGLTRILAAIDPANAASLKVAEKLGMRYEREIMFDGYDHPDHLYILEAP